MDVAPWCYKWEGLGLGWDWKSLGRAMLRAPKMLIRAPMVLINRQCILQLSDLWSKSANWKCNLDLYLSPASTVSSQMLITHLFLLFANLPSILGTIAFLFILSCLPGLFFALRLHILPRCLSNLTHATDLRVEKKEISNIIGTFIQSLQLQSSKVSEYFINGLDFLNAFLWFSKPCD